LSGLRYVEPPILELGVCDYGEELFRDGRFVFVSKIADDTELELTNLVRI